MVGYSIGFSCVFDPFVCSWHCNKLPFLCSVCVGAGDGVSCLGIFVMFVVGLALRCSLVLRYIFS